MNDLEQLVAAAKQGDKNAFERLYESAYRSVYFTCVSMVKNAHDAEELTQDTFTSAYQSIAQLGAANAF